MRNLRRSAIGAALGVVLVAGAVQAAPGAASPVSAGAAPATAASATVSSTGVVTATKAKRGPTRILLTAAANTSTAQRISWNMGQITGGMKLQYRKGTKGKIRSVRATRMPATHKQYSGTAAPRYTVLLRNLKPATGYSYRVATKYGNSKWRKFRTTNPKGVYLIGLGDTQVAQTGVPKATVAAALKAVPSARAILHAGDVVHLPTSDAEWAGLFSAIGDSGRTRSWIASMGNHERCVLIVCNSNHAEGFRKYFPFAGVGYPGQGPTWGYVDFPGSARIVVLDSFGVSPAAQAAFLNWALAHNPNPFSIVLMHAPVISSRPGRSNAALAKALLPVLENRNADLVLTGHDHSYARGYRKANGTVFVTSVSGHRYFDASDADWRRRGATRQVWATGTATYQAITITKKTLTYRAVVTGRGGNTTSPFGNGGVLDRFTIDKTRPGDKIVR